MSNFISIIDDNKYHWGAFLAGLGEDDLKEVVLVLDDAEPCIPAEAVRWGIFNLIKERDEALAMVEKNSGSYTQYTQQCRRLGPAAKD